MRKKPQSVSPSAQGLRILLLSVSVGVAVMLLLLFAFSVMMTNLGISGENAGAMAMIALCVGSYIAGFIAAFCHHKNGLMTGLFCGAVLFGLFFLVSIVIPGGAMGLHTLARLLLVLCSAAIGGVFGVNFKWKRY